MQQTSTGQQIQYMVWTGAREHAAGYRTTTDLVATPACQLAAASSTGNCFINRRELSPLQHQDR
jgi:hypothetical protein